MAGYQVPTAGQNNYMLGAKTEEATPPELCACCGKCKLFYFETRFSSFLAGYMKWFCFDLFCGGFAMNSLSKRMGMGGKVACIIGNVDSCLMV